VINHLAGDMDSLGRATPSGMAFSASTKLGVFGGVF